MNKRKDKYSLSAVLLEEKEEEKEETEDEAENEDEEELDVVDSGETLDGELSAVFIDFETKARKVSANESSLKLSTVIYESQDIDEIDIDVFSAEVARLVKNYDNLLDIENVIVTRAKDFLETRYGVEASTTFIDNLDAKHDIEMEEPSTLRSDLSVPLAVGASSSE
jgi:hypothetical protein